MPTTRTARGLFGTLARELEYLLRGTLATDFGECSILDALTGSRASSGLSGAVTAPAGEPVGRGPVARELRDGQLPVAVNAGL